MTLAMFRIEPPACHRMAAVLAEEPASVVGVFNQGAPPGVPVS
jgi:hypothetical protein